MADFVSYGGTAMPAVIQTQYQNDPRYLMAQRLVEEGSQTGPVGSWGEGLGRMGSALVGGWQMRGAKKDYEKRAKDYQEALAAGMERLSQGDTKGAADIFNRHPDLADFGTKLTLGDVDYQRELAGQQAKMGWEREKLGVTESGKDKRARERTQQMMQLENMQTDRFLKGLDAQNTRAGMTARPVKVADPQSSTGYSYKNPVTQESVGEAPPEDSTSGLTPGQQATDKAFAKEYVQFKATGGIADVQKGINQLKTVLNALETEPNITGKYVGVQPDIMQSFTNPRALAVKEQALEVAQRNLRLVLGAQFTQKEGDALIKRVYNDRLPASENVSRIKNLITQIENAAMAKQSASDYFEEHGTLSGWQGKLYTLNDFDPDVTAEQAPNNAPPSMQFNDADIEATAAKYGMTPEQAKTYLFEQLRKRGAQ